MASISISEFLKIIYVQVDDWYQLHGFKQPKGNAQKPILPICVHPLDKK